MPMSGHMKKLSAGLITVFEPFCNLLLLGGELLFMPYFDEL